MRRTTFWVALMCLFALVSCNKDEEHLLGLKQTSALVTVHAVLQNSHDAVDSVRVEVIGRNAIRQTDAMGCAIFDLPVGEYELKITRDGYLGFIEHVSVGVENGESDMPIIPTQTIDVKMYPLTATLKGSTTINRSGNVAYLADAKIEVLAPSVTFISPITVLSGTDGSYTVENVPEGLSLNINASFTENGAVYKASQTVGGIEAGESITVPTLELSNSVSSAGPDITTLPETATSPLVLTFYKSVDVENIMDRDITVERNGTTVGIKCTWSNNNRTLSIQSVDPDGWYVAGSNTYNYSVNLKSIDGDAMSASGSFGIPLYTGQVGNITSIQYDSNTQKLSWTKLSNVEGYRVYVKKEGSSDYTLSTTSYTNPNDESLVQEVYVSSFIFSATNEFYYVKVVGFNSESEGSLADAKENRIQY